MRDATVTCLGLLVVLHVLCMLCDLDPTQGQGLGHGPFELPTIAHKCTFHISRYISSATFAWSSKLMVDIDSMGPGLQLVGGRFSNFLLGKV